MLLPVKSIIHLFIWMYLLMFSKKKTNSNIDEPSLRCPVRAIAFFISKTPRRKLENTKAKTRNTFKSIIIEFSHLRHRTFVFSLVKITEKAMALTEHHWSRLTEFIDMHFILLFFFF